ncbi:ATP-binding protein [Formosimonas limnophila]|uniref:ATP-binding protein n=1 Tax=Formosimonas limnophila TaxID=1384487 RepID=A0A8J3CKS6_9BURK|nr:helicase HerA-like C-terminal domain-containing protein [Formosimonas limnophila]GHA70493.1 ATP-binding protein [Formosimonas limnophila]
MAEPILLGKSSTIEVNFLPQMGNRHGLITGATGTGKTVSLQALAQHFVNLGVPVFMADVKGDLAGISQVGGDNEKVKARLKDLGLPELDWQGAPTTLWDVFGEKGHPVRATISDMGPLLLSRMLDLNDTQTGVLNMVFRIADDNGMLLLDLKDLRAMLQYVGENAKTFTTEYGNVSAASIGAVQRGLLAIEEQGAGAFFGEPMLNIADMMQTVGGKGVVNILAADKLMNSPRVYGAFLLWMLSELFENLPEVGDVDKPKFVFFFDEAHLLFNDAPKVLLEKIEQVVRLIRSKGVGVYFVTQNPIDIPDTVLGQLGNRVQHALRAFTPRDQKAVQVAATTMRENPDLDIGAAITELGVGEALVSTLDEKGRPNVTQRVFMIPPESRLGPATEAERATLIKNSIVAGVYDEAVDSESAYEKLQARTQAAELEEAEAKKAEEDGGLLGSLGGLLGGGSTKRASRNDTLLESVAKSTLRSMGTNLGRTIVRGVLGSLFGGKR